MADSPLLGADGPVTVTIKSGGNRLRDDYQVVSVRTHAALDAIPEATIVLLDGEPADERFTASEDAALIPGAEIEIAAGYGAGAPTVLFKGVATALRARIGLDGARLEVRCRDKGFTLTRARRSVVHERKSDSDIIAQIARDAGLEATVDATNEEHAALVQARCTDWDFIRRRAAAAGLLVALDGGRLTARAAPDDAPALTLTYGVDIDAADLELSAEAQYGGFDALAWDPTGDAAGTATGAEEAATGGGPGDLAPSALASGLDTLRAAVSSARPLSDTTLKAAAKAAQGRAARASLQGRVAFAGSALATPGGRIEIRGLSARHSGVALIGSVSHRIEAGAWRTEVGVGAPSHPADEATMPDPPQPLGGLQIGKVTKLDEDPDGQSRIQIALPMSAGDGLQWARFAAPYASDAAGFMALPEVGDEVVVAFIDEDATHPVVLGSLHNPSRARPGDVDAQNNLKTFVSRAKLTLAFDEEKKTITLETPGGASITLDDTGKALTLTDQAGSTITMDSGGISLKTSADITLQATGSVKATATGDASITGANVEASGDIGAKVTGGASAEVSSGGNTKVAGAMVMIN